LTQKELNQKVLISQKVLLQKQPSGPVAEAQKRQLTSDSAAAATPAATYASGTPLQLQENFRKKYSNYSVKGTGKDGRVKDDAVNATPSMGTPTGGSRI
jgi:2-oxoglutarate dehydrogenase E2 component (dihydrolipoamide succinyltransferase)